MKHIKFRILIIVWSSMILLFFAFAGILNIVLPSHFVSEAEDALEYEIDYQHYISNSNDESEDDSSDYYEEDSNEESTLQKKFESGYQDSYFTSDIYYIDVTDALNDKNTSEGNSLVGSNSTSLKSTYELTEWVKNHNISEEQIYTLQTDNGYYVFTVYEEPQNYDYWDDAESDENDSPVYLMYINIDHIVKYTRSLNWLISAIFLCAIVVMSIIGYRLGVKIEESQKTQRRFFQNSSHELKTPLMAIQGYAEGIEMDVVDPQNAAGIIMQETERMTGLVEEILSISKIDSRHFKLDLVKLDIKEVLYDCFRSLDAVQQMNSSVLAYLENSAEYFPEKCAVTDEKVSYSYSELVKLSSSVGTALSELIASGDAVGIYMEKCADAVAAFFATVYAGGFYSVLNTELPQNRLQTTVSVLNPKVIVTSESLLETAKEYFSERKIVTFEDLAKSEPDYAKLGEIRSHKIDTDPLYINFTSGSTGTPKGIVVCHRSVIDFIDHFTEIFGIDNNDVIANQAPFDFDVSVKDIYSAVKTGATLVVVPRRMFSAPAELIDFICDRRITVMIWAVSALCLISTFHALDYRTPETVNKILFSGEVMPLKALKNFRSHLPNAKYVNLYGPTEITCNCTYHILDNDCDYADGIPIGKPFPNEDVIILDENNNRISEVGKVGEICVRGTALALGYYSNPEQNAKAFVQNPLNPYYPELIYRTGDLARYNENGELVFSGRKDFQIKYMGHRIELEEIEREMSAVDGVEQCCCIFDEKKSRLKGFFVGSIEKDELAASMSRDLPAFMIPGVIRKVDEMPLTKNGKIDRKKLAEIAGGRRK